VRVGAASLKYRPIDGATDSVLPLGRNVQFDDQVGVRLEAPCEIPAAAAAPPDRASTRGNGRRGIAPNAQSGRRTRGQAAPRRAAVTRASYQSGCSRGGPPAGCLDGIRAREQTARRWSGSAARRCETHRCRREQACTAAAASRPSPAFRSASLLPTSALPGRRPRSPSTAPSSAHRRTRWISSAVSGCWPTNGPFAGSAFHGGM
jgi:hypothetical protein